MTMTLREKVRNALKVSPPFQLLVAVAIPVTVICFSAMKLMEW